MRFAICAAVFAFGLAPAVAQSRGEEFMWFAALNDIGAEIEEAAAALDRLALQRLALEASKLMGEGQSALSERGRLSCIMAIQSLRNYASSVSEDKVSAARADLRDWKEWKRKCQSSLGIE